MINVKNVTKEYKKTKAVDNLNLTAQDGEITILLGDNGAGKSTTIKSIIGLLNYQGEITIDGFDNRSVEAKKSLGYIPEVPILYDTLTIKEHVEFIVAAHQTTDYEADLQKYLEMFDLVDKVDTVIKELSKGMKQKVSMILAFITRPKTLLVDEPMIGLDPQSIELVLQLFKEQRDNGVSLFMSTHIIDIISEIWDVAYIMHKGVIVKRVTREEIGTETLKEIYFNVTGGKHHEATV